MYHARSDIIDDLVVIFLQLRGRPTSYDSALYGGGLDL